MTSATTNDVLGRKRMMKDIRTCNVGPAPAGARCARCGARVTYAYGTLCRSCVEPYLEECQAQGIEAGTERTPLVAGLYQPEFQAAWR
jgi:hypothetical protein